VENISNIQIVDPNTLEFQDYQQSDEQLISSFEIQDIKFNALSNSIEYHIFDSNKNLINSNYNFRNYSIIGSDLSIEPKKDLTNYGFEEGQYYTLYNFLTPLLNSSDVNKYYISEVSSDRTEVRISSNTVNGLAIKEGYVNFISSSLNLNYFKDFYLNFGNNDLIIANNILLDESNPENISVLIKLYEPLPNQFDLKSELWVVETLSDSIAYFFELITVFDNQDNVTQLRGPNLNIDVKDRINNSTSYINYNTLQTASTSTTTSSLTNQLNNILKNKSIRLNIDYSNYDNFIHFSSAETRLENFYYKLSLIESYKLSYLSSSLSTSNFYLTSSQNIYLDKIKEIEENFDGYEYHLYYNSGSTSWPKVNSIKPYVNYPTTSSLGNTFLSGSLASASLFDSENKDALINTIPLYIKEDPDNAPYELFVEMLGQHFDTLYVYYGEITNKYSDDNRINYGASKDLISDILKDFGVKIYQNNFSTSDLYSSFLGLTNNLNSFATGSEKITTFISASSDVIPLDDNNVETYKRIYHNLPLLLKKKGTIDGLRLLINLYGIPDTILRINEFGGKNKDNSNDWDQWQNQFNYAFFTTSSGWVQAPFDEDITATATPQSLEFRFKPYSLPLTSSYQILATTTNFSTPYFLIALEYTGSSYLSSSYSASVIDPYNTYGTLKVIEISTEKSASIYLPFFNGDWWSVLVTCDINNLNSSSLYAANNIYSGDDGNEIGFKNSSSFIPDGFWYPHPLPSSMSLSYDTSILSAGKNYQPFSGSFQELRYYNVILSESIFLDYTMNPYSIEGPVIGNEIFTNNLMFRAPLGSVLDISGSNRTSIHPSQTQYPVTQSTSIGSGYKLSGSYSFIPNKEFIYFDQFPSGIKNIVSNKIKIVDKILPSGSVISPYISIQQQNPISESYTRDINYLEVAFSPQNEINEDIVSQLGYFNIGEYIGDPRQLMNTTASSYPDFNKLRDIYFSKYQRNYNLNDYIRLIKFFDNSLFKLIKDFIPARTSLASGIIIKQHLLERNRYSPSQVEYSTNSISGSFKSFPFNYTGSHTIYKFSGGNSGVNPELNGKISSSLTYPGVINITQSYTEQFKGPKGLSYISHSYQEEFFNGQFKGSTILASTQSLNNNSYLTTNYQTLNYNLVFWNNIYVNNPNYGGSLPPWTGQNYNDFLTSFINSDPGSGEIAIYVNPNYVNYIKINTTDSNSINQEAILDNLKEIDIIYTNNTTGKYQVSLLGKSSTSNFYSVQSEPNFYVSDGKMFNNYNMSGSHTASFTASSSSDIFFLNIKGNIYDPNNYLNSASGFSYYSIPTSSTIPYINSLIDYQITMSINNTNTSLVLFLQKADPILGLTPVSSVRYPANTRLLTGSFVAEKGSYYRIILFTLSTDPVSYYPYLLNNITASFTQRNAPQSGSLPKLISIPSTNELINFQGSKYDVTYGSVDKTKTSQYFDIVEYNGYKINNTYFNQLLSSSGTPALVKDYYYKLKRHIKPRYLGSRNTSDNFNTSSISQSVELQNNLKLSLDPSQKEGVASKFDTTIFEYTGGENLREMPNFGRINLNQIISTDNTSSADIIKPNDSSFKFIIDSKLTNKNNFIFNQYDSNIGIPTTSSFFSSTINPEISAYIIPSDATSNNAASKYINSQVVFSNDVANSFISTVKLDNNKNYITGSLVFMHSMSIQISNSIAEGNRWFISLFSGSFITPIITSGIPLNDEPYLNSNFDELAKNSIYEITLSLPIVGGCSLYTQKLPTTFQTTSTYGGGRNGVLIWKMAKNSNQIILSNTNLAGLSGGNFVTSNILPKVKDNINYIVETFGNKPKN